jgi:hypothetical protein
MMLEANNKTSSRASFSSGGILHEQRFSYPGTGVFSGVSHSPSQKCSVLNHHVGIWLMAYRPNEPKTLKYSTAYPCSANLRTNGISWVARSREHSGGIPVKLGFLANA